MKIAVIFPSRGLAFSQTCDELLDNLEGYDWDIFFSHGLSIPNCFNKPLERALEGDYTHFWFVEDDMILPKNTLKKLLAEDVPAIACDYPMSAEGKPSAFRDPAGNAIYVGTGCLLVTREFIEKYPKPVFRSDIAWDMKVGESVEMTARKIKGDVYGLHDVTFSLLAPEPIKVSKVRCGHRKLKALGQAATNKGEHQIDVWTKLKQEKLKVKEPKVRNVWLGDDLVFMDIERAKLLEKEGKAKIPPFKYVELLNTEIL